MLDIIRLLNKLSNFLQKRSLLKSKSLLTVRQIGNYHVSTTNDYFKKTVYKIWKEFDLEKYITCSSFIHSDINPKLSCKIYHTRVYSTWPSSYELECTHHCFINLNNSENFSEVEVLSFLLKVANIIKKEEAVYKLNTDLELICSDLITSFRENGK